MKRRNKKYFTLIELLFVVAVLVIIISISWVAGTNVIRKQTVSKTKAEILMLTNAIKQYNTRWGYFPSTIGTGTTLNFANYLSNVLPNSGWTGKRPMYVDFGAADIMISDVNLDDEDNTGPVTVSDPYEQPYIYKVNPSTQSFIIYSLGLDAADNSSGAGTTASPYVTSGDDIGSDDL